MNSRLLGVTRKTEVKITKTVSLTGYSVIQRDGDYLVNRKGLQSTPD